MIFKALVYTYICPMASKNQYTIISKSLQVHMLGNNWAMTSNTHTFAREDWSTTNTIQLFRALAYIHYTCPRLMHENYYVISMLNVFEDKILGKTTESKTLYFAYIYICVCAPSSIYIYVQETREEKRILCLYTRRTRTEVHSFSSRLMLNWNNLRTLAL